MESLMSAYPRPLIHCFDTVSSCMDTAFELVKEGRLAIWDSVTAKNQTSGRGQMRKTWISIPGNLFAAIRLPKNPPFSTLAASVATSVLFVDALQNIGYSLKLKWPNDLIIISNDKSLKVCGILIEERNNILIAGIGINIFHAPSIPARELEGMLPAGALSILNPIDTIPSATILWQKFIRHIYNIHNELDNFANSWKRMAESYLLWRGEKVIIEDYDEISEGILIGLSDNGGALIKTNNDTIEKLSGTIRSPGYKT